MSTDSAVFASVTDVIIIGGGPAGMSAALVLGRARRSVLVIDEALPRHRVTRESHGFLTRDGVAPAELRKAAREQIAAYPGVAFIEDSAVEAEGVDGDFRVTTAGGTIYRSRKLLFAAGMKDLPMDLEGLEDVYGKSAYVCPYCDGWEMQDRPIAVIAGKHTLHLTRTVAGWTDDVAVFMNGTDLPEEDRAQIQSRGIPIYEKPIARIESEKGETSAIVLSDGTKIARTAVFFAPRLAPGSELPAQFGCAVMESGAMIVDETGRSNVPGVFGAGDGASQKYQVAAAVAAGSAAGAGINFELLDLDWERKAEEAAIL
ncbi:NAD(P)/FAD-dependent oxidoreductase [Saccharibacillus alkalitolerans]|uniref:NAD(P)/FAD-dependent oxidoreductase n=1 Tax=Saccharibacillus alkalitolerans TaxID=2705290 RepID=A0ABX0F3V1_9BACL|nr:NAD(P)/FAD-dependent oxidoreductase [Saccharibacillus alkalitolerans]NGZ74569.1 NAD(P)/FAD-dependent oxidoreductase [Saccharibacillus alkalitolerans]